MNAMTPFSTWLVAQLTPTSSGRLPPTRADLARRCGVSLGAVSGWCSGRSYPRPQLLSAIAEALGLGAAERCAMIELMAASAEGGA